MCEWEVTSFAITLPFPLTTHINLRNLYQLTDPAEAERATEALEGAGRCC